MITAANPAMRGSGSFRDTPNAGRAWRPMPIRSDLLRAAKSVVSVLRERSAAEAAFTQPVGEGRRGETRPPQDARPDLDRPYGVLVPGGGRDAQVAARRAEVSVLAARALLRRCSHHMPAAASRWSAGFVSGGPAAFGDEVGQGMRDAVLGRVASQLVGDRSGRAGGELLS
ncbi:hypothetical protein GCM10020219_017490 [Nonomuraea dietziae]